MTLDKPAGIRSISVTCVVYSLGCGGAEGVMADLSARLAALGHKVTVLTLAADIPDFFPLAAGVTRARLPGDAITSCRWFDLAAQRQRTASLLRAILETRPEIIISFLDTTNVAVLMALRGSGLPVVVAEHTDPRYHDIGWRWSVLRRLVYPAADAVTVLNESIRSWGASLWPRWRVRTIPNPLESLALPAAPVRPESFGLRNIVAMGRLAPEKGFDLLIEAFAAVAKDFPEWHLTIFGEGSERKVLEQRVARHELNGRVSLPGRVREPRQILPGADLFVLSSRYEGFGMALAEAMAAGLPVVSFNCPSGPAEIIRDGIDGVLVPPENESALAAAMARLMGDEAERRRLGEQAKQSAGRFAPERVMALWQALIEELTGGVRSDGDVSAGQAGP